MNDSGSPPYYAALQDFQRARRKAILEQLVARLTGRSADLLSFEDVRRKLKATPTGDAKLENISLDSIVGSVGRYVDFTRSFLPKQASDAQRWAKVETAAQSFRGLPPIEVYKVGEVHFVKDGNHRVSVARQFGNTHIQAYVTEVTSKVPLTPDVQPDDLILKAEYNVFLERTGLDKSHPEADFSITVPGGYRVLEDQIQAHRHHLSQEETSQVSLEEAAAHWCEHVYTPIVAAIRELAILRDFPNRTETDLAIWVSEQRSVLFEELDIDIKPESAATHLAATQSEKTDRRVARAGEKLLSPLMPEGLETGARPGDWRREREAALRQNHAMFSHILVPISGVESEWLGLEQALEVARREGAHLHGLHVVPDEAQLESQAVRAVQKRFDSRCAEAGLEGKLNLVAGRVTQEICRRARWTDLIVANLRYPPGKSPASKIATGFDDLIRRCFSPILAVPGRISSMSRALLAYDGSPKAREALFVAAYLAGCWNMELIGLTVADPETAREIQDDFQEYLHRCDVQPLLIQESGAVGEAILRTAETHGCDLIIMGGYRKTPLLEVMVGTVVDEVLTQSPLPTLVCR